MEYIRELLVIDDTEPVGAEVPPSPAPKKRKVSPRIAAAVLCLALIAGAVSPVGRYSIGNALLERGSYAAARTVFVSLGDYKDAEAMVGEAEKGFVYLDAEALLEEGKYRDALALYESLGAFRDSGEKQLETKYRLAGELLEQGEREAARDLFAEVGSYRDAETLAEELRCQLEYEKADAFMLTEKYDAAEEKFRLLGDYRDAEEKAAECRYLAEVRATYEEGRKQYKDGKWLAAYRSLSSIRDAEYEETLTFLEEIESVAEDRARYYAEQGKRGKMLAFLQLAEEIDPETGAALRQELAPEETFRKDQSYYMFDLTEPSYCAPDTTAADFLNDLLYMLIYGKTELTIMSSSQLDKATTLGEFFTAENLLSEILPGYGSIYDASVVFWENGLEVDMDYEQEYNEHQRNVHLKTYKDFCEESVRDLTAAGLLSKTMSYREQAEIIAEWIGFYLTYDDTLVIHDAGVAVEEASGVCEAYASLYHRMCNLAGIPTYGQLGEAGEAHIWLIHVDEEGKIFYADPTWADSWDIDFTGEQERPTVADFVEQYLERCMIGGVTEYLFPNYVDGAGQFSRRYLWSGVLWSTHTEDRMPEEIIELHQKLLGKTA